MSKNEPPPPPGEGEPIKEIRVNGKSVGIGDTVSKFIKMMSRGKIQECPQCKKRKEKLNKMFPYKKNDDEEKVQDN